MDKAKLVSSSLAHHFRISYQQYPSTDVEKEEMRHIPYALMIGSLMYAMVCTRPDIGHSVDIVSRFLSNSDKQH